MERVAYSPREFAALFGKSQTWGYRQIYNGSVASTTENGRTLIPASEVQRLLNKAKPKKVVVPEPEKAKPRVLLTIRQVLIRGAGEAGGRNGANVPKSLNRGK